MNEIFVITKKYFNKRTLQMHKSSLDHGISGTIVVFFYILNLVKKQDSHEITFKDFKEIFEIFRELVFSLCPLISAVFLVNLY